jgi:tripartite-type tricarboxylate transporter receptor subunit TctC
MLIAVKPSAPIKDLSELIAYGKAHPGKLNYGTNGIGAWTHIGMEVFMDRTGARMTHVPYTGNAPVMQAALAGDIDVALVDTNTAIEHVRAGTLRPIAHFGSRNSSAFPELPNLKDSIPELQTDFWMGVFAPAATPKEIIALLNREINAVIHSPQVEKKAADVFMHTHQGTPEEFSALIAREWETWGKVIREKGLVAK